MKRTLGLIFLALLLLVGAFGLRLYLQRAEHQRLREADATRAPVISPLRPALPTVSVPAPPACLRGRVTDHGAPVAGMQVSASDVPPTRSGDCPCPRSPVLACSCREGLAVIAQLPRAGLVEAVRSAVTDAQGAFELCQLPPTGRPLLWGEHLDGRLALVDVEQEDAVELRVVPQVPFEGLVLAHRTPVAGATVHAFLTPSVFVRTFTTDARGRFSGRFPLGAGWFVISGPGVVAQRLEHTIEPRQLTVLEVRTEAQLTVRVVSDGRPVAGADVWIGDEPPVASDAQGRAVLPSTTGRVLVRATKGELLGSATVVLLEGKPREVELPLVAGVRVQGVVKDEEGQPRAAAKVRGLGRSKLVTDEGGRFRSEPQVPGTEVHPVASAEGCADSPWRTVEASAEPLVLTVACRESVTGTVVDAEGKPIAGASVHLDSLPHDESVQTDARGRFAFHLPPGMGRLEVRHELYRSVEQPLTIPAKDVTVVLDAGGSISGRVVDGQGQGVAGAEVLAVPAVLDALLGELEGGHTRATADGEGFFTFSGLVAGRTALSASAPSMGVVVSEVLVLQPGEHREGVVLKLDERVDVQGSVLDAERRPIAGARVQWDPADEKSAFVGLFLDAVRGRVDEVLRYMPSPSATDAEGHFVLRGLPTSKVKVSVRADGFGEQEKLASRGDTLDFVLQSDAVLISGRVVDERGQPLPRFTVDGARFTAGDGRFETRGSGREQTLSIEAEGYGRRLERVTVEGPSKDLGDLALKPALTLQVEVRDDRGKPLEGARVAAAQTADGDSCRTNAEGRCHIGPLVDGETQVKAVKDGYGPLERALGAGQLREVLVLTLAPVGGRVTGTAFALPGLTTAARQIFVAGAVTQSVLTEQDGRFEAKGLPEGPYCVSMDAPGLLRGTEWAVVAQASPTPSPVQVGPVAQGATLLVRQALPGRLTLIRDGADPLPIQKVAEASAAILCDRVQRPVITAIITGELRLEGIPPGRWGAYLVSLTSAEDPGDLKPVLLDLRPGETKSLP